MSTVLRDLGILLRLRWKLLLRSAITRYTRSARLAAPIRFTIMVVVGLWILAALVLPAGLLLTVSLRGAQGRLVEQVELALARVPPATEVEQVGAGGVHGQRLAEAPRRRGRHCQGRRTGCHGSGFVRSSLGGGFGPSAFAKYVSYNRCQVPSFSIRCRTLFTYRASSGCAFAEARP